MFEGHAGFHEHSSVIIFKTGGTGGRKEDKDGEEEEKKVRWGLRNKEGIQKMHHECFKPFLLLAYFDHFRS